MAKRAEKATLGSRAEAYWEQSRQPLAGLVFLAPLLAAYEAGAYWLGAGNGAEGFFRWLLAQLGFGQQLLLPVIVVCILLAMHHTSLERWRLSGGVISAMAVESLLLGATLCAVAYLCQGTARGGEPSARDLRETVSDALSFLGAGIYEELLFRLMLLSAVAWALRRSKLPPAASTIVAVMITSLMFAAAHNVVPGGESFQSFRFAFRTLAGGFFAVVFLYRGFGIAAGSHAVYDLLVGVVLGA
jgi:hypothetical protein